MSFQSPPPDPTNPDLLDNLRAYLISQGLVRDPRDSSTQDVLPPMWLAPRFGTPAPGQTEGINPGESDRNLVIGANFATDTPPPRYEGFRRIDHVELMFRGRNPQLVRSIENKIRAAINDKRGWMMVNFPVNESLLFRGLQFIGSDNTGFAYAEEYVIETWGPFTPVS